MTTDKLAQLKTRVTRLDATIANGEAKELLLGTAKTWLKDVESASTPGVGGEFLLSLIEQQVRYAETVVAKYGPQVRITGSPNQ
jgi:hypothetical protein